MPDDPPKLKYFLHVEIAVKPEKWPLFIQLTGKLLPRVKEERGWKLIAALSAITNVPNTVLHIWELPDANSLLETMDWFASDPLIHLYPPLLACCDSQRQQLYTSMSYNPLGRNP